MNDRLICMNAKCNDICMRVAYEKRREERQRIIFLVSLCKWMNGQVPEQNLALPELLITARDRRE